LDGGIRHCLVGHPIAHDPGHKEGDQKYTNNHYDDSQYTFQDSHETYSLSSVLQDGLWHLWRLFLPALLRRLAGALIEHLSA